MSAAHLQINSQLDNPTSPQKTISSEDIDFVIKEKIFNFDHRSKLVQIIDTCKASQILPAVMWQVNTSSKFIYFSVYTDNVKSYSKLARVVVRCSVEDNAVEFTCPCSVYAKYKSYMPRNLAHVHLIVNKPEILKLPVSTPEGFSAETHGAFSEKLEYLKKEKTIPVEFDQYFTSILPTRLQLGENVCSLCPDHTKLNQPILTTTIIHDVDAIHKGKNHCTLQIQLHANGDLYGDNTTDNFLLAPPHGSLDNLWPCEQM